MIADSLERSHGCRLSSHSNPADARSAGYDCCQRCFVRHPVKPSLNARRRGLMGAQFGSQSWRVATVREGAYGSVTRGFVHGALLRTNFQRPEKRKVAGSTPALATAPKAAPIQFGAVFFMSGVDRGL
jgi:hypothetical protein